MMAMMISIWFVWVDFITYSEAKDNRKQNYKITKQVQNKLEVAVLNALLKLNE